MRILFMGSAEIACETLTMLMEWDDVELVGVVTQPDRHVGRKLQLASCPAKRHAEALGVEIYTPENVNREDAIAKIRTWQADMGVVMAYGQILRPALLAVPRLGLLNIHTSLLPRYRGAAPIQRAIANGDTVSGVTVMQMDAGMDTGDILAMASCAIGERETAGELHDRLGVLGARLLRTTIADIAAGNISPRPQPTQGVTYAPRLQKSEGRIDWTQPARRLYNQIRGFNPWPCCYCQFDAGRQGKQNLRVLAATCCTGAQGVPGEVLPDADRFVVACGEGALVLDKVQPPGGKVMSGTAFLRGRRFKAGTILS
jgi:methionyl-tRNA formyltransferase